MARFKLGNQSKQADLPRQGIGGGSSIHGSGKWRGKQAVRDKGWKARANAN